MGLRVAITPEAGGSEVVLCDAPDPLPVFNFRINNQRVLRVQRFFRATYAKVYNQRNMINRISFQVPARDVDDSGVEFGGTVEALAFAFDHANAVPVLGVIEFRFSDGGAPESRWFDAAGVESVDLIKWKGTCLAFQYSIIGGEMLTEAP